MQYASKVMKKTAARVVVTQAVITAIITILIILMSSPANALAVFYGGIITVSGTVLMAWRITRVARSGSQNKADGYREMAIGVVQKFIFTILLFAFGMGYLNLTPAYVLIGFAVTQISYMFNRVDTSYKPGK